MCRVYRVCTTHAVCSAVTQRGMSTSLCDATLEVCYHVMRCRERLTAKHCNTLLHTATHCNTLQRTATHCITLQHTASHCNTLRHTATHCNTLQRTATHRAAARAVDCTAAMQFIVCAVCSVCSVWCNGAVCSAMPQYAVH